MGGDKGKSQQKVLVFASGIRKVFGHPFNWREREGVLRRTPIEDLQAGGRGDLWSLAAAKLIPSTSLPLEPALSQAFPSVTGRMLPAVLSPPLASRVAGLP